MHLNHHLSLTKSEQRSTWDANGWHSEKHSGINLRYFPSIQSSHSSFSCSLSDYLFLYLNILGYHMWNLKDKRTDSERTNQWAMTSGRRKRGGARWGRGKLKVTQWCPTSHVQLFATPWSVVRQAPLSLEFSRPDTGVGSHSLLQGTFTI